jgi:hypothetical protein
MRVNKAILGACLLLCGFVLVFSACNQPFEPIKDNSTSPFSIFGYLDASVDTQRVRISPLREELDFYTEHPEMTVTLENPATGEFAVMNDYLHRYAFPFGLTAPNAWTTMNLDYGKTYRLRAERPDGASTSVTVTTPDDIPTPRLFITGMVIDKLYINDVESLVDVQSRWFYRIDYEGESYNRLIIIPYRDKIEERGSNDYVVNINTIREQRQVDEQFPNTAGAEVEFLGRQIFVAAAGPEWDEVIPTFDDLRYALPDAASNVENGVGYVIGIVSKSIPYKNCFDEEGDVVSCPAEQPIFQ